jgi:small subunit ribosomal protein S20
MANTTSAKKATRKMIRRTEINKQRTSRLKTEVRKVEEAVTAGNKAAALEALKVAEPLLARTAQKGGVHRRAASRKTSRLVRRITAMSG